MPHCEDCDKYWTPNSMPVDGRCPTCGRQIAVSQEGGVAAAVDADDEYDDADDYTAPWHFKLMVVLAVVYLGWRFLQLFGILT